nr:immunoglobulin heavy chain junction region [Mus musculus]
CTLGGDFFDYW